MQAHSLAWGLGCQHVHSGKGTVQPITMGVNHMSIQLVVQGSSYHQVTQSMETGALPASLTTVCPRPRGTSYRSLQLFTTCVGSCLKELANRTNLQNISKR